MKNIRTSLRRELLLLFPMMFGSAANADLLLGFDVLEAPEASEVDAVDFAIDGFTGVLRYSNSGSNVLEGGWSEATIEATDRSRTYGSSASVSARRGSAIFTKSDGAYIDLEITNGSNSAYDLTALHFDFHARSPNLSSFRVYTLPQSDLSVSLVDAVSTVAVGENPVNSSYSHPQDLDLSILDDTVLSVGESAVFRIEVFGDTGGGHPVYIDNVGISGEELSFHSITTDTVVAQWDDDTLTPGFLDNSAVSVSVLPIGDVLSNATIWGSTDGSFGSIDSNAHRADKGLGAIVVRNGSALEYTIYNASPSDLQLNSLHLDFGAVFGPTTVELYYKRGDLSDDNETLVASYTADKKTGDRVSGYKNLDWPLDLGLTDRILASGQSAVLELRFSGAGSDTSNSAVDNILLDAELGTEFTFLDWVQFFDVVGGVDGDNDGDGFDNLLEYATGADPIITTTENLEVPKSSQREKAIVFDYPRRRSLGSRLKYVPLVSFDNSDPYSWSSNDIKEVSSTPINSEFELVRYRYRTGEVLDREGYARVQIVFDPLVTGGSSASDVEVTRNISYGNHSDQVMDTYLVGTDTPAPVAVYIHGGGWTGGTKELTPGTNFDQIRESLHAEGIHFISIDYRTNTSDGSVTLPTPVHDAARAIQYIRYRAKDWNIDPDRVAVLGGSAGGSTSLWLLFHDDLANPTAGNPVSRESTRVLGAAVQNGQSNIDPIWITENIGELGAHHTMILYAVGESSYDAVIANYDRHESLYTEFSPMTHMDANDPPYFGQYNGERLVPAPSIGRGIHHSNMGLLMKERSDELGHVGYIDGDPENPFSDMSSFLIDILNN